MVAYRNNPCVVIWESNNGLAYDGEKYLPSYTLEQVKKWDYIQPRLVQNRDGYPPEWDKDEPVVIGYTNRYEKVEGSPSWNTEVYGRTGRACPVGASPVSTTIMKKSSRWTMWRTISTTWTNAHADGSTGCWPRRTGEGVHHLP